MKTTILLLSVIAFTSIQVNASQTTSAQCSADKTASECQAYIVGLVEGYVASKQNYLPKQPVFSSQYLERAFASRVGKSYSTVSNKEPACLPSVVDKNKVVEHLMSSNETGQLTTQLGDYLRANYTCAQTVDRN